MFKKEQTLGIRIWHWLNSATIFLLFLTVFLRKVFFGKESKSIILSKSQELGAFLTEPQAREIARAVRNNMWQWHPIIGFIAISLLVFRIILYFKNKKYSLNNSDKPLIYKIVKNIHKLFYILLGVMGLTGSILYWKESLHISEGLAHNIQEVHETLLWFFVLFVITHILGVIKGELSEDKGIVSDMINGGK